MTVNSTVNIFIAGVGGQGIGLMGDVLCRGLVAAGKNVMSCETHGVAQRGGTVTSQIRFGPNVMTPKISAGTANIVLSLERLEAARFAQSMLKNGGTLIYYDAVRQPLSTRADNAPYPGMNQIEKIGHGRNARVDRVHVDNLPDSQMQNVALLAHVARIEIIEGINEHRVRAILKGLIPPRAVDANLQVFDRVVRSDKTEYSPNAVSF